jgi:acetylornithine deacetylase/succinyl-diaminopimelate desuccinylase-like protein
MDTAAVDAYLRKARDRHLEELTAFLRIASVSALPAHKDAVAQAAAWLAERLRTAGTPEVRVLPTAGHPVVYGRWHVRDGLPTILIYGHYDVQPVDPVALWESPPFEPTVRDGALFARGATDDKGSLYTPIAALDAVRETAGAPPLNLKFLFEGEEEIGSPSLGPFIREHRALLEADLAVSADGSMLDAATPSLTIGNRGLSAVQIDARGARTDLHSGVYGGAVPNPIHALAALLAGMHDAQGRVAVEGFYDEVRPLSDADRREIARVPFNEASYCAQLGVASLTGEPEYTPAERVTVRPTLEINGIWGGFQGDGIKTVLPAEAHAKITCRLVPDQDPERIAGAIEAHVRRCGTAGVNFTVSRFPGKARAYLMPSNHPGLAAAARALKEVYGKDPVRVRIGGTLPVSDLLRDGLGMWLLFFAFGEPDNRMHAPNEFFRLASFERGTRAYVRLFEALGQLTPEALRAS